MQRTLLPHAMQRTQLCCFQACVCELPANALTCAGLCSGSAYDGRTTDRQASAATEGRTGALYQSNNLLLLSPICIFLSRFYLFPSFSNLSLLLSIFVSLSCLWATSTVRVIHFSSQNCIQADIQSARPLPHMNLNVSERLICTLRGLSRFTDRVTGKKTKQLESEENANMEMMEMEHGDDGGARDGARGARGCARLRAWVGRDLFFQQMMTTI